jgi:hypothetical protein
VEILSESQFGLTPEVRNLINEIANAFESIPSLGVPFMKDCLALTKVLGPRALGDAILHRQLALKLWRCKDTGQAKEGKEGAGEADVDEYSEYRSAAVLHFALGEAPEALWGQVRYALTSVRRQQNLTLC